MWQWVSRRPADQNPLAEVLDREVRVARDHIGGGPTSIMRPSRTAARSTGGTQDDRRRRSRPGQQTFVLPLRRPAVASSSGLSPAR